MKIFLLLISLGLIPSLIAAEPTAEQLRLMREYGLTVPPTIISEVIPRVVTHPLPEPSDSSEPVLAEIVDPADPAGPAGHTGQTAPAETALATFKPMEDTVALPVHEKNPAPILTSLQRDILAATIPAAKNKLADPPAPSKTPGISQAPTVCAACPGCLAPLSLSPSNSVRETAPPQAQPAVSCQTTCAGERYGYFYGRCAKTYAGRGRPAGR